MVRLKMRPTYGGLLIVVVSVVAYSAYVSPATSNNSKLLITWSCHDAPTLYFTATAFPLVEMALDLGWEVHVLFADCPNPTTFECWMPWTTTTWCPTINKVPAFSGKSGTYTLVGRADRAHFEAEMNSFQPDVYIGMGHGFYNYASGQNMEPLLATQGQYDGQNINWDNTHLCAGKKVFFMGCDTINVLGPKAIASGCLEFYGYNAEGTPLWQGQYEHFPSAYPAPVGEKCTLNDLYCRCSIDIGLTTCRDILNDKPALVVYENTIARCDYWLNYYAQGGAGYNLSERDMAITWLKRNKSIFRMLEPARDGDITGPTGQPDGKCDMRDIALMAINFGRTVPPAPANCDLSGPTGVPDGIVNMHDIGQIAVHYSDHYR